MMYIDIKLISDSKHLARDPIYNAFLSVERKIPDMIKGYTYSLYADLTLSNYRDIVRDIDAALEFAKESPYKTKLKKLLGKVDVMMNMFTKEKNIHSIITWYKEIVMFTDSICRIRKNERETQEKERVF